MEREIILLLYGITVHVINLLEFCFILKQKEMNFINLFTKFFNLLH